MDQQAERRALAQARPASNGEVGSKYDVIVIGAGLAGMCQLYRLRELGLSSLVLEAGGDIGGTWYWNRYPGARLDSESYTYGYSFSNELLQEWNWPERFCTQPVLLRYCNYVADKFNLRRDMIFNSRVVAAVYDESTRSWIVEVEDGRRYRSNFIVTAIGTYSAYVFPRIQGIETFTREAFHTYMWPHNNAVSVKGKRVAVFGTGSTGVQVIQTLAKEAERLVVFQRRANWCTPLWNARIDAKEMEEIKAKYPEMFELLKKTPGAFIHMPDPRRTLDLSDEERERAFEAIYRRPGLGVWQGNLSDLATSEEATELFAGFLTKKIRARIGERKIADRLIPKDHGPGTKRIQQEIDYYEAFNRDNVELVNMSEDPVERITPKGVKTKSKEYEFDMIIYATGFDVATGPFDRIDIRGVGERRLKDKWKGNPVTLLGLAVNGFPNFLTIVGPHNAAARCNMVRCIEQNVDWITDLLRYMRRHDHTRVEASPEAEQEWSQHVVSLATGRLYTKVRSAQYTGINTNVEGRNTVRILTYTGGVPAYRERCDRSAANGYQGFLLS